MKWVEVFQTENIQSQKNQDSVFQGPTQLKCLSLFLMPLSLLIAPSIQFPLFESPLYLHLLHSVSHYIIFIVHISVFPLSLEARHYISFLIMSTIFGTVLKYRMGLEHRIQGMSEKRENGKWKRDFRLVFKLDLSPIMKSQASALFPASFKAFSL